MEQMELPRGRVKLEEETEEVRVRLPKRAAAAVAAADPKEMEHMLRKELDEAWEALCTPWYCWESPPGPGIYEITDHKTGTMREFRWFTGAAWTTEGADEMRPVPHIFHHSFATRFAWRGLRAAPLGGYSIPPYARHMFEGRKDKLMPVLKLSPELAREAVHRMASRVRLL